MDADMLEPPARGIRRRLAEAWQEARAWFHRPERTVPWGLSLAAHALLILLAFFIVWTVNPPPPEERPPIIVSFDNPAPAPLPPEAPLSTSAEAPIPESIDLPEPPMPSLSEMVARLAPDTSRGGDASEDAIRERRLPEVRFAGLGVSNAADIVYVVDASGSMVPTLPIVLDHLRRSVSRLARTQRFQVIFYGPEEYLAAPHPGDVHEGVPAIRLIRATPENISRVLAWADGVLPGGRGDPIPALKRALWLKPDAVFLLSNIIRGVGEWKADKATILSEIDALNPADPRTGRRRTLIKTIQFLDDDPAGLLEAIGTAHGGDDGYRFIPRTNMEGP